MRLIIGLGNPGEKYAQTRHNVGFMVVDALARKWGMRSVKWEENKRLNSLIINHKQSLLLRNQSLAILAKPQTMMNGSGYAVEKILRYCDIKTLGDLWVVHDDLDLSLGKIKIRVGGGTGGHHGVESIMEKLGDGSFVRFRLGIGRPGRATTNNIGHREIERYVLEEFSGKEKKEAEKMVKKAMEAIILALEKGLEAAMNKYNLK